MILTHNTTKQALGTISNSIATKKQLGQYFSGSAIATLLANLANSDDAEAIIDPMCGTGDMLAACNPSGYPQKTYVGIEIDNPVFAYSLKKFKPNKNVTLIRGNAFDLNNIEKIASVEYDLVIANPPYVRYQTLSRSQGDSQDFINPSKIKSNLIASLPFFKQLDKEDRRLFQCLIANTSGLSDLAVPSWILCALLTKIHGRIAIVVPQTWLNRDYASIVRYILLRWFQIEYVIEDGHSKWFSDAQIKTTLIVAKRVNRKSSIFSWKEQQFTYCTIFSEAKSADSLVGEAFPNQENPEQLFLRTIAANPVRNRFFYSQKVLLADFANDFKSQVVPHAKWLNSVEPASFLDLKSNIRLKSPSQLSEWLQDLEPKFQVLSDIGVTISQGLRTGANIFFYLDILKDSDDGIFAVPNKAFSQNPLFIPKQLYREVVRKQSELNDEYCLTSFKAKGIVLDLRNAVCTTDIPSKEITDASKWQYQTMPANLDMHVRRAATTNIGTEAIPKFTPDLSAVKPNIKFWNPDKPKERPRFWYMLPSFNRRHSPDLFVPRINGSYVVTRLNQERKYLIDANFSTLWIAEPVSTHNNYSLLALLNSSWCVIAMEEYGTVMGGGALKLEATQLNKIPIPILGDKAISDLSDLGLQLTQNAWAKATILEQIDQVILRSLGVKKNIHEKLEELISMKEHLLKQRSCK